MDQTAARGFVLGATAYGEADKIAQLYTHSLGRVKSIVKGIRKPKSKLASSIDLFTESAFTLHRRSGGSLYVLGQAKIVNGYAPLKRDFESITALQVLAELLTQALPEAEPHPEVYALLKKALGAMEADPRNPEPVLTAFALKLLDLLGYPLELSACVECGETLVRRTAILIPHRGGALCGNCCATGPARLKMTPMSLEVLKKLRDLPMERVHVLKLRLEVSRGLFLTLMDYWERILEKPLKTLDYYLKVLPAAKKPK